MYVFEKGIHVNNHNERQVSGLKNLFLLFFIGGSLGFLVILIILQFSGRGFVGNTAKFTQFQVCLDTNNGQPINVIPIGTKTIYLCGLIEGKGILQGALDLYQSDRLIENRYFEHFPGVVSERISIERGLEIGQYRIEIISAKRVIAKTKFTVAKD